MSAKLRQHYLTAFLLDIRRRCDLGFKNWLNDRRLDYKAKILSVRKAEKVVQSGRSHRIFFHPFDCLDIVISGSLAGMTKSRTKWLTETLEQSDVHSNERLIFGQRKMRRFMKRRSNASLERLMHRQML